MNDKQPSPVQVLQGRVPLYVRMGFGLIIAFGMVGNCAGHREGAVAVFIITSVMWACIRILTEALEAYRILTAAKAYEAKKPDESKKDEPPTPPDPPAAT